MTKENGDKSQLEELGNTVFSSALRTFKGKSKIREMKWIRVGERILDAAGMGPGDDLIIRSQEGRVRGYAHIQGDQGQVRFRNEINLTFVPLVGFGVFVNKQGAVPNYQVVKSEDNPARSEEYNPLGRRA